MLVTRQGDESFKRIVHGKASSGSSYACISCDLLREDAKNEDNFGNRPITVSNIEEREAASFVLDNPLEQTRKELEKFSLGQKNFPVTTSEPNEEVNDTLHQGINNSDQIWKMYVRIFAQQDKVEKKYVYANIDENKDENKTAEERLKFALQGTTRQLSLLVAARLVSCSSNIAI